MTSDFDNDEIKDSAFPVEFTDDATSLDMYGVWVKSGPRDATTARPEPESVPLAEETVMSPIRYEDISDIDSLPELPDFDAVSVAADEPAIQDEVSTETPVSFAEEETLPEQKTDFDLESSFEEINSFEETETIAETENSEDTIPPVDETFQVAEEFSAEETPLAEESVPEEKLTFEQDFSEIVFEEIETGTMAHSVNEPEEPVEQEPAKEVSDSSFNMVDASEFFDEISDIQPDFQEEIAVSETMEPAGEIQSSAFSGVSLDEGISFDDILPDELKKRSGVVSEEKSLPAEPAKAVHDGEKVMDINSFEEVSLDFIDTMPAVESIPEIEPVPETAHGEPQAEKEIYSDDDFSSFLDDLNSGAIEELPRPSGGGSDNVDLDSFIDSFNEMGGAHEDETKLFDDAEPVDLELEFDESFIEDSEKIRATGSAVSESEFFNSEFGVELIDETTASSANSAFEQDFNAAPKFSDLDIRNKTPAIGEKTAVAFEETSEFDDLLSSLDLAPAPAQAKKESPVKDTKLHAFDLVVTEDDELNSPQPSITESASSDDVEVALFGSDTTEENLAIPEIKDYNSTEPVPDTSLSVPADVEASMAPDFDDISALEQELNDMTPVSGDETVTTNDKSTELLMIIADELSSIKQELTTLKSELATFKSAGLTAEPASQIAETAPENSGFFSDDDTDETIALTGDELNNILITADFTEEKNESEEIPENEQEITSALSVEATSDNLEIPETLPDSIEASSDNLEIPETLPDSIFDIPPIESVSSIEVSHVNTIEDDVSYLEGSETQEPELDNVAIEEPELETIDFDDEKLEEPELTEFNIDLSEIEDSFIQGQDVPLPEEEAAPEQLMDQTVGQIQEFSDAFQEIPTELPETDALNEIASFDESAIIAEPAQENEPSFTDEVLTEVPVTEVVLEEPVLETVETLPEPFAEPVPETIASEPAMGTMASLPVDLKNEIKSVLSYMDQLLESLPEEKIEEFAKSEHFEVYKKLFEELGIS